MILRNDWKVYGKALISALSPHELPNVADIQDLLKKNKCLFARWSSEFDCQKQTEWWYCIKDNKIELEKMSSKQRYRIKKGINNIDAKIINPNDYIDELFNIAISSFAEYPKQYKPNITYDKFKQGIIDRDKDDFWGFFDKETHKICAYSICSLQEDVVSLSVVKVIPAVLMKEVNAAIGYFISKKYLNEMGMRYIYDGERNIRHQTNYQNYLVKNIGFRFAYCKLNIIYRPWVKLLVNLLYPFRKIIKKISSLSPNLYNVYSVLKQEEIRRTFK